MKGIFKNHMSCFVIGCFGICFLIFTYFNFCTDMFKEDSMIYWYIVLGLFIFMIVFVCFSEWLYDKDANAYVSSYDKKRMKLSLPTYNFGYYYPNKKQVDIKKFKQGVMVLSQGKIEIGDTQHLSYIEFHEGKGSLGYYFAFDLDKACLGVLIEENMSVEILIHKLNQVIENKGYDLPLLVNDIKEENIEKCISYLSKKMEEEGYFLISSFIRSVDFVTIVNLYSKEKLEVLEV